MSIYTFVHIISSHQNPKKTIPYLYFMIRIWLILTAIWFGILLFINVNGNFPLNDDWQYAYAVKSLVENGELSYRGQFSPIVLVQVLWGAIFCKITINSFSFTALRWSTLVLVPLLVGCVLKLGMKFSLSKKALIILGLSLFATPLVMALAPSFMSDVPFAFVSIAAILCYWNYVENNQKYWLLMALVLSVLSFYIRQPGMVLPAVFGLHYWWTKGRSHRQLLPMFLLFVFAIVLLLSWEQWVKPSLGLSDNFKSDMTTYLLLMQEAPLSFFKTLFLRLLKSFTYLGLFSLPLAPFIWPRNLDWKKGALIGVMSLFLVIAAYIVGKVFPFGGNIFYNLGLGPELLADVYTLGLKNTPSLSLAAMCFLHYLSIFWAFVLVFFLVDRWPLMTVNQRSFLQLWLILSVLYFPLMSITSYYDRYVLLPLLLLWPILLIHVNSSSLKALRWLPLCLVIAFSISATHDYLAWNRAKLTAFHWLENENITIRQMDAGYELNGWYNYGAPRILNDTTSFWWVTDNQYLLTFGPVTGYESIHKIAYKRWLWAKEDFIFVLRKQIDIIKD